ncbi:hemerythrin domain-containing protein [Pseudofrankia sp. BMG5.36]|uniref:hemerythrin domain-containing protein n=1 Tax=Pseudofrankia sp. BMG5.36 TaxID=1834512 RepID=UPI0008DA4126|nr:hemerythrin domain-containing protein [Pseudofrankia sp. BMG5.36]OHV47541.1 hypothetical protein BCD48_18030 [Pseudofrankia sp. BMG5.36]
MLTTTDLSPIRLTHVWMRGEFGRLARAARTPRDAAHAARIEDEIASAITRFRGHQAGQDELVWPVLRDRAPAAATDIDRLEGQRATIAVLLAGADDRSFPLAERADMLAELHLIVNEHLDAEERLAFPLLKAHLSTTPDDAPAAGTDPVEARRAHGRSLEWRLRSISYGLTNRGH